MRYVVGFFAFWYDFVVGDDWRAAATAVAGLVGTALLVRVGVPAWWLLPLIVIAFMGLSLTRVSPPG